MKPYLIWAEARSASTALSTALREVSSFPHLEDEPFNHEHACIYDDWCETGDPAPVYRLLEGRPGVKHIAEQFDDNFNADVARAANHFGYRHIRLDRRNVFAQLASRGIAEQLDAWRNVGKRFSHVGELKPFDVDHLLRNRALAQARWGAVSGHIPEYLVVWTEELTDSARRRRHAAVTRLLNYLDMPLETCMARVDDILSRGAQGTEALFARVPNIGELFRAVG